MDEWDPFFGEWSDYIDPIDVGPITPYPIPVEVTNITGTDMNDPQFDDFSDDTSTSGTGGFWESLSNAFGQAASSVITSAGQAAGTVINRAGNTATGAINNAAGVQTPAQAAAAQAAQQQKILMLAAGAVALVAVLYFYNRKS